MSFLRPPVKMSGYFEETNPLEGLRRASCKIKSQPPQQKADQALSNALPFLQLQSRSCELPSNSRASKPCVSLSDLENGE